MQVLTKIAFIVPRIKLIYKIFLLSAVIFSPFPVFSRTLTGPQRLRARVEFLTDSLCAGRSTGTSGSFEAASYILRCFESCGMSVDCQTFDVDSLVGHNIIGRHIGRPSAPMDYVLVIASYDGMGTVGGRILPGADANASGGAALLEIAGRLKDSPHNYVFVALDAHNRSLAGAKACMSMFRKPGIVVNLDTMGSILAPVTPARTDYLIALGGIPHARELEAENIFGDLVLYYDYYGSGSFTDLFYRRISDHKFWLENGVDCLMFTSGITENTNKWYDDAVSLDYDIFSKRVDLISRWLAKQ